MTRTEGYLAYFPATDADAGPLTLGFAPTEEAATLEARRVIEEANLDGDPERVELLRCDLADGVSRWAFADDDVLWIDGDDLYVRPGAVPDEG